MAQRARRREFAAILIGTIATVRVVIARNATVQMEEADCRWKAHSNHQGGASERSKRIMVLLMQKTRLSPK